MAMVRLEQVSKRYGPVVALSAVDLSVEKGEFVTLLGPSGSGKTTLLNLIAGMVAASSGRVFIRGRDVTDVPPSQRDLGMVFQNYALMPHMTVFENIAFPLRVRKMPAAEIRAKVEEVLRLVQLPDVAQRKPRELSGGQQQRISIARCLVYNPSLILMDEPLGALDRKLREQMQLEIKRLHAQLGITVLYVTHDQEEAMVLSDRICLMNRGRIEQLGKPHELYFRPATPFVATFLGESNLLDVTLADAAPAATVRGPGGCAIRTESPVGLAAGAAMRMLVRPEHLRPLEASENACNEVSGTVSNVIFVGGITCYYVRLADGTVITARRLTEGAGAPAAIGSPIRLGWTAANTVLFPAEA
ncbi:MAG: ABC transporter ATP-binding protein [Alphaproteobacteria bacterium]|nr:ABC transporter ATP-binding protein [Alphaproteobacteria bacterium]